MAAPVPKMAMLKTAATTAFASRRRPALAGRIRPTVPRIGAAITAQRKIRKPSSTSSDAVRSNMANSTEASTAMNPAPIRSMSRVPWRYSYASGSSVLICSATLAHCCCLPLMTTSRVAGLVRIASASPQVRDLASYRAGPYFFAVSLSAEPSTPRSQFR